MAKLRKTIPIKQLEIPDSLVAWVDYSETSIKNIKILGLKEHSELLNSAEYLEEEL